MTEREQALADAVAVCESRAESLEREGQAVAANEARKCASAIRRMDGRQG